MDKEFLIFQILLKHIRKKKCRHIFKFNVNLRKLSYAVTAEGISELRTRSQNFARRTFELANKYNEKLLALVAQAKNEGKKEVWLFGNSYIKFLLIYACQTLIVTFVEKAITTPVDKQAFCIVGELNN